jgi:hypothetical protein
MRRCYPGSAPAIRPIVWHVSRDIPASAAGTVARERRRSRAKAQCAAVRRAVCPLSTHGLGRDHRPTQPFPGPSLVGDALVIRSKGTVHGMIVGRLAAVNLRSGRVTLVPEPIGGSGDVLLRESRLYAVQGPGTHAFAYEVPSMKRLARFSFPGAITRRLSDLTLGEAPACVALSPDSRVFALSGDGHVYWFDAATGRAQGDVEVSQSGDFFSCLLHFTPGGERLARATDYGALHLTELASGKTLLERDDGRCINCDHGPIASGSMEWSGRSLLADKWSLLGRVGRARCSHRPRYRSNDGVSLLHVPRLRSDDPVPRQ